MVHLHLGFLILVWVFKIFEILRHFTEFVVLNISFHFYSNKLNFEFLNTNYTVENVFKRI